MIEFSKFLHLASAIVWLGGMSIMLWAVRPVLAAIPAPEVRLPALIRVLRRFFQLVWVCIVILLATGGWFMSHVGAQAAPLGWHLMSGLGSLMCLIFGHLYFSPYRKMKGAVANSDWASADAQASKLVTLVKLNCALGWIAVFAVAELT